MLKESLATKPLFILFNIFLQAKDKIHFQIQEAYFPRILPLLFRMMLNILFSFMLSSSGFPPIKPSQPIEGNIYITKNFVNKGKINQIMISEETVICNAQLLIAQSILGVGIEKCERNAWKYSLNKQYKILHKFSKIIWHSLHSENILKSTCSFVLLLLF